MLGELTLVGLSLAGTDFNSCLNLNFKHTIKSEFIALMCNAWLKLSGFKLLAWVLQFLCLPLSCHFKFSNPATQRY